MGHQALQFGVECNDFELAGRAVDLLHDARRQVNADATGQLGRIGDGGGGFGQALDDRAHVANVHTFFEKKLQNFLQCGNANHFGNHVFDQFWGQLRHMLDELLGLYAAQQFGCVQLHQV